MKFQYVHIDSIVCPCAKFELAGGILENWDFLGWTPYSKHQEKSKCKLGGGGERNNDNR